MAKGYDAHGREAAVVVVRCSSIPGHDEQWPVLQEAAAMVPDPEAAASDPEAAASGLQIYTYAYGQIYGDVGSPGVEIPPINA